MCFDMNPDIFGPGIFENENAESRKFRLKRLKNYLEGELQGITDHKEYFAATEQLISILKSYGHDLWSWDYDGEGIEEWGGNYMKPESAGKLYIKFTFQGEVLVNWEELEK